MGEQGTHGISWTDTTWNPIRGCSRISPGCTNCYAEKQALRMTRFDRARGVAEGKGSYDGLVHMVGDEARWTGVVRTVPDHLTDPLRWTRPRRVFVNSMSDMFHEALTNEDIAAMFGVMAASPRHTFQILTKRAKRMWEWFRWVEAVRLPLHTIKTSPRLVCAVAATTAGADVGTVANPHAWPLPNVWMGVSTEDQKTLDERAKYLLDVPAFVHWISYEPGLGEINPWRYLTRQHSPQALRWVVIGGESGDGSRPFNLHWARIVITQCRSVGVAAWMKQFGAHVINGLEPVPGPGGLPPWPDWPAHVRTDANARVYLRDKKGGDMTEWPEDVRVRQFPVPAGQ